MDLIYSFYPYGYSQYAIVGNVTGTAQPVGKIRWRSRGRHDPGSGPYTNRIAIGGRKTGRMDNFRLLYYGTEVFPISYTSGGTGWCEGYYWDGARWTYVKMQKDPEGSHPTNPKWDHWYATWWTYVLDPSSIRPYGNRADFHWLVTGGYQAFSYLDAFQDSEQGALEFANRVLSDYTLGGLYPTAFRDDGRSTAYAVEGTDVVVTEPQLSPNLNALADHLGINDLSAHTNAGIANAYIDACNKLPHTSGINNIANIVQTLSTLKSLLGGSLTEVGRLGDIWLGWRYEYSTTKLDIEEVSKLVDRLYDLSHGGKRIRSNGFYRTGDWEFRVSITVLAEELGEIQSLAEKLGVELSAYNAWDLVPYSFIADWFLHVGDLLERWSNQKYAMKIAPLECWWSMRTYGNNQYGCYEIFYHRGAGVPNVAAADLDVISHGTGKTTVVKRAIDTIALFT